MIEILTKNNLFVLTGAPGVGKSALISELSKTHKTVGEPAREIIAEQRGCGGDGLWEINTHKFVDLLVERSILKFMAADDEAITFFDRGIPDNFAYPVSAGLK